MRRRAGRRRQVAAVLAAGAVAAIVTGVMVFRAQLPQLLLLHFELRRNPDSALLLLSSGEGSVERRALNAFFECEVGKSWMAHADVHPWLRMLPPGEVGFGDEDKIETYWRVPDERFARAEALLRSSAVVEIDRSAARELGVRLEVVPEGKLLCLVRGLFLNKKASFGIWHEGNRLLVDSHDLSPAQVLDEEPQMRAAALVVPLVSRPVDIFVQCAHDR